MPRKKKDETQASISKTPAAKKKPAKAVVRKTVKSKVAVPKEKTPKATRAKKTATPRGTEKPVPAASKHAVLKKLPRHGETQMVAFIRDPRCIFTYWEVSPASVEAVKKQLMDEYPGSSMALRVFQVGPDGKTELLYEVNVEPGEKNRYLELKEPGGRYYVEVVQRTASGRVVTYARSNWVSASSERPSFSTTADPQWAPPAGILEYFNDGEEGAEFFVTPIGLSSAEAQRRRMELEKKKSKWDSYAASRAR